MATLMCNNQDDDCNTFRTQADFNVNHEYYVVKRHIWMTSHSQKRWDERLTDNCLSDWHRINLDMTKVRQGKLSSALFFSFFLNIKGFSVMLDTYC